MDTGVLKLKSLTIVQLRCIPAWPTIAASPHPARAASRIAGCTRD